MDWNTTLGIIVFLFSIAAFIYVMRRDFNKHKQDITATIGALAAAKASDDSYTMPTLSFTIKDVIENQTVKELSLTCACESSDKALEKIKQLRILLDDNSKTN